MRPPLPLIHGLKCLIAVKVVAKFQMLAKVVIGSFLVNCPKLYTCNIELIDLREGTVNALKITLGKKHFTFTAGPDPRIRATAQ